ncbi:winged helix-turn-helix domain-containing protein [Microcoleus sp. Pol17_C1]|uniref:winged helix-turn-helix domain-containing protein n=1 Tax=unclassified Microcoleus TaxID=2642155 RepID=UPI002FD3BAA4
MSELKGYKVSRQRGWEYLKSMKFRLRVPRPEHQESDREHPDFASIKKYDKMRCFWEKPTLSFLQKYV